MECNLRSSESPARAGLEAALLGKLALLLGGPGGSRLAKRLLARRTSRELFSLDPWGEVLAGGGTPLQARRLEALQSIAPFLLRPQPLLGPACQNPADVARLMQPLAWPREVQVFWAIHLDVRRRPIQIREVSVGSLASSLVHPREVFRDAVRSGASSLIVAHNHPSGDPEPSGEDMAVTRRLVHAGEYLGIALDDHLIIGRPDWVSLRSRPGWPGDR